MLGGPGGGGNENEFELLSEGRWFIDRLDIEFPKLLIDDRGGVGTEVLLLGQGFAAVAAPQFTGVAKF